jgi:MFS family permease
VQATEGPTRILSAAMVVQFSAGGCVVPFVSLLLRDRGLELSQISVIFTASSATLLVFPFLWGMLADRFVPLNRLFFVLNALSFGALAALAVQRQFTGMLLAYTCFFACFNPIFYLVNALSFHHLPNPREQFGRIRAWGSAGWIVPFLPISLWVAREPEGGFDFVLYLGMACCAAMAALSFLLPHTPPGAWAKPSHVGSYKKAVKRLLKDPNYLVLIASMFLVAGSFSLLMNYSPPLLEDVGVARPWIGPIQAIGVVFEILLFKLQPGLIRRWNFTAVIIAGCVALALRHLLFGFVTDAWVLSASYLLAGMVVVFYHTGVSVLVNTMATVEVRATAQTLLLLAGQGLGPLFANAVTVRLTASYGKDMRPIFLFASALAVLAATLIALRKKALNTAGRQLEPPVPQ